MPELTEGNVRARIAGTRNKTALAFAACVAVLVGAALSGNPAAKAESNPDFETA